MAAARQESASAALLVLCSDLPHIKRLGCSIGETVGRMPARAVIDAGRGGGEFCNSMAQARKAREFRDVLPARTRGECGAVPIATEPDGGRQGTFAPWRP